MDEETYESGAPSSEDVLSSMDDLSESSPPGEDQDESMEESY